MNNKDKIDELIEAIKKIDDQALANLGGSGTIAIEDLKREKKKLTRYAKAQLNQLIQDERKEARLVELDLLEQAMNRGVDMNEYKAYRLAELTEGGTHE